jgi:hypothetical protein
MNVTYKCLIVHPDANPKVNEEFEPGTMVDIPKFFYDLGYLPSMTSDVGLDMRNVEKLPYQKVEI